MTDLIIAIIILVGVCGLVFCIGLAIARQTNRLVAVPAILVAVAATIAFGALMHGRLVIAEIVPFSSAIVLGNWLPVGIVFMAGMLCAQTAIPLLRRIFLVSCLIGLGAYSIYQPLSAQGAGSLRVTNSWTSGDVLLQSNGASCSACASATLLRQYGIKADEAEMMRLCFTSQSGTPTLGLFRGLKIKTNDTSLRVVPFQMSVEDLLKADEWPVLLLVELPRGYTKDPRFEEEWGWTPGQGHSVVLFGLEDGNRLDIGDPAIGREQWMLSDLRVLWQGEGLRLERRSQDAPNSASESRTF